MIGEAEFPQNDRKTSDGGRQLAPLTGFFDLEAILERKFVPDLPDTDYEDEPKALVDVGGGEGAWLAAVLEAYPTLSPFRVLLQDRSAVVEKAKQNHSLPWRSIQTHDFFTEQPVRHARAYHLRRCLCGHSDDECVRILRHLARAMGPCSKLLIAEDVMSEPAPCDGLAFVHTSMPLLGSTYRTLKDFEALFHRVGLRLINIHRHQQTSWVMMETCANTCCPNWTPPPRSKI